MNFEPATLSVDASRNPPSILAPRVLVLSHSHPRLTRGGSEISAAALARELRAHFNAPSFFLGCSTLSMTDRIGLNLTQPFGESDFVYQSSPSFEHFKFANRDVKFPKVFGELIEELKPDILHFHHYTNFGVEAFAIAKRVRPQAKIVLTLHEYLAICNNHGQMVKTGSLQLCEEESTIACSKCFSALAPRDFFLRKSYIQMLMEHVDQFISPSRFLADRYVKWGVPAEKMLVLENVPPERPSAAPAERAQSARLSLSPGAPPRSRVRIGFFGQMSPLKGVLVLLDAAKELQEQEVANLRIDLFGDYSHQPKEFRDAIDEALKDTSANVRYHGPYDNARVHTLMRSVDAVVVPSIWWENAPVVIEEALINGRPVICSDIGGMAEAVRPGLDGLWFTAGDSTSLAEVLMDLAENAEILVKLRETLRKPKPVAEVVGAHLKVYRELLSEG